MATKLKKSRKNELTALEGNIPRQEKEQFMVRSPQTFLLLFSLMFSSGGASFPSNANAETVSRRSITFCKSARAIALEVLKCGQNQKFTEAASTCFQRLNRLETELGKSAIAISQEDSQSQLGQNTSGLSEYSFSEKAFQRLDEAAKIALEELKEYEPEFNVPEHFFSGTNPREDPFETAERNDCFGGEKARLRKVIQEFQEKRRRYSEGLKASRSFEQNLAGKGNRYGNLVKKEAASNRANSAPSPGSKKIPGKNDSTISGLPNNKK
mgnify:CR=1 FL=1